MLEVEVVPTVATTQKRKHAVALVFINRFLERADVHAKLAVRRNLAQSSLAQTQRDNSLVDRRVCLFGSIDAQQRQVRASAHAFFANAHLDAFARGGDRMHARNRRGVIDDAAHAGVEADHLSQPVEHDFFQFSRRRRRAPQHRLHIESGAQ